MAVSCISTSPKYDRVNDATDYDAEPGALGRTLAAHHVTTGVVANADLGLEMIAQLRYRRPAGATVMNESGEVPLGTVSDRLLHADTAAPWGVVLDEHRVLDEFRTAWSGPGGPRRARRSVGPGSRRGYAPSATAAEALRQRRPTRWSVQTRWWAHCRGGRPDPDAVLIVAPVRAGRRCRSVGAGTPGTRARARGCSSPPRPGGPASCNLSDVAPTVLDLFGLDVPTQMEGRPMRRSGTGGSVDDRVTFLVDTARDTGIPRPGEPVRQHDPDGRRDRARRHVPRFGGTCRDRCDTCCPRLPSRCWRWFRRRMPARSRMSRASLRSSRRCSCRRSC